MEGEEENLEFGLKPPFCLLGQPVVERRSAPPAYGRQRHVVAERQQQEPQQQQQCGQRERTEQHSPSLRASKYRSPPSTSHRRPRASSVDKGQLLAKNAGKALEDVYALDEEKIGQGTFGVVRRGKHLSTGVVSAIKVIAKAKVKDQRQLKREVSNMHQLDHPNIVRLYETFEDHSTTSLVMELCTGGELFHAIVSAKHRRLGERDAAIVMDQITRAVLHMHKLDICHRDLKPENFLFLTNQPIQHNTLKLIDFGLSCRCTPTEVLTEVVGTASYVAPQVLDRSYDKQCDLWSAGIILYIMLCGHPPFRGKNQRELLQKVREGNFVFDARVWQQVSREAKGLISALLRVNPQERYTAEKAMCHEWLLASVPQSRLEAGQAPLRSGKLVQELRAFRSENRLKKAALHVIIRQLSDEHTRALRDIFRTLDADNDGMLSIEDLKDGLAMAGVTEDVPDLEQIVDGLDLNGTGCVDYTEFLAAAVDRESFLNEDICMKAFNIFDVDGDGKINRHDLRKVLDKGSYQRELAANREELLRDVDRDGNGSINFKDFMHMMKRPTATASDRKDSL